MPITQISVDELKTLQASNPSLLLLDVRELYEHQRYHLSELLIPLGELPHRLAELQAYKDKQIIVYCEHGVRSLYAAQFLQSCGFKDVYSLEGGIAAYLNLE